MIFYNNHMVFMIVVTANNWSHVCTSYIVVVTLWGIRSRILVAGRIIQQDESYSRRDRRLIGWFIDWHAAKMLDSNLKRCLVNSASIVLKWVAN